jgi:hypothetical protein
VTKKSTPVKPQAARKIAPDPQWWPYEHEDIDQWCALEAIRYGNGSMLARYLREVDEIDPRVRRELAKIMNPKSGHLWRFRVCYRFRGPPVKGAKDLKAASAKLVSGENPIGAKCYRTLAEMLDPKSRHPLRVDFQKRNSGRPSLGPRQIDWLPLVRAPMEKDAASLVVRRAEEVRGAKNGGRKVPVKQLHDGISRATYYRRKKELAEIGLKRTMRDDQIIMRPLSKSKNY